MIEYRSKRLRKLHSEKLKEVTRVDSLSNHDKYLVPTRKRAQALNEHNLDQCVPTREYTFHAKFGGKNQEALDELQRQFETMILTHVTLKINCRVMLVSNLDVSRGLVVS